MLSSVLVGNNLVNISLTSLYYNDRYSYLGSMGAGIAYCCDHMYCIDLW